MLQLMPWYLKLNKITLLTTAKQNRSSTSKHYLPGASALFGLIALG
jgi:hypothetical protein